MKKRKNRVDYKWAAWVLILTFVISILLSTIFTSLSTLGIVLALCLLFTFIALGILFDILGIAVTSCPEAPFHSMATRRVRGAKESIWLIRNNEKTANFCNDIIGDITGIVSGTTAVMIAGNLAKFFPFISITVLQIVVTGIVAGLTVGGKSIGKNIGINKDKEIMTFVGRVMHIAGIKKEI